MPILRILAATEICIVRNAIFLLFVWPYFMFHTHLLTRYTHACIVYIHTHTNTAWQGGGFDPNDQTGYSCVLVDSAQGSCVPFGEGFCPAASSSGHTLPTSLRGPSIGAASVHEWGLLSCVLPAWLYENRRAVLRLYRGNELIEKVYTALPPTKFVGVPYVVSMRMCVRIPRSALYFPDVDVCCSCCVLCA